MTQPKPDPHETELHEFILDSAARVPMPQRSRLLRGLAAKLNDPDERRALISICELHEEAERRFREFAFKFTGGAR